MFGKSKVAVLAAEFLGTIILCLTVFQTASSISLAFFPAIAAGLTVTLLVMTIGNVSGAHVNPAVTLSLWTQRKIETGTAIAYIAVQMLGGLVAWKVIEFFLNGPTNHIATWGVDQRVLLAEALGTFIFTFGIAAAIHNGLQGIQKAVVIGGSLSIGILAAAIVSNGLLNPAVAVAMNSVSWAYMVGPLLGGILGANLYAVVFTSQEKAVPAKAKKAVTKKRK